MARSSSSNKKPAARGGAAAAQANRGAVKDQQGLRGNSKKSDAVSSPAPATVSDGSGRDIAGVVLAVAAVASFIAVVAPSSAPVTSAIASFYHLGFGLGAYVLPFALLALAVGLFLHERSPLNARVLGGAALVFTAVLAMLSLLVPASAASDEAMFSVTGLSASGGYLGAFVASALKTAFGRVIALVVLAGLVVVGLVIIGFSISDFVRRLSVRVQDVADEVAARRNVPVNQAPWGDEEADAGPAKTTVIDGRGGKHARGQQRIPFGDEDAAPPTTFLGGRETSVRGKAAAPAASAQDPALDEDDEDPLVDLSAQLEAERAAALAEERATTRLIPIKERFVEVEGPVEVPYASEAPIGVAPVMPTIDATPQPRHIGAFVDLPDDDQVEKAPFDGVPDGRVADGIDVGPGIASSPDVVPSSSMDGPLVPFVDLPDDEGEEEESSSSAESQLPVDKTIPASSIPSFLLAHTDTVRLEGGEGPKGEATPSSLAEERASSAGTEGTAPASRGNAFPQPATQEGRVLPPLSMLRHNPNSASAASTEAELEQTAEGLQGTLAEFGLHARVTGWISGPTVTTFKVQPGEGERVSRISNLEDDIALSLAAQSVRIFAPIPGTSLVGIEIPNAKRQNVNLADVLPYVKGGPLELAVGRDAEGTPVVADLAKMPHLLIAGTTGSGKSVMINSIIMTLLMRTLPEDVRLIMVDPKRVELAGYNGLPHLYVPVVTEPKQAASALQWAVSEMERRLKVFERLSVRKISTYNEKQAAGEFSHYDNPPQKMPYMVIIIDELSDLMMVAGKDVEASIVRIAQLGRAAGIHLIVATQRPSSNVVTGLIKANITNRIAFNVATGVDSRVIIDQTGAEKLTGLGDMLFSKVGWGKPKRIQGCFVSDDEIYQVVEFVKSQGETDYHEEILSAVAPASFSGGSGAPEPSDDDPLLWEAAHIVVESQLGSTSGLQRRLKVGYARAGRIMDMLEEHGIVGPPDGSKPREVLLDEEGLAALEALEGPLSSEEVEGY